MAIIENSVTPAEAYPNLKASVRRVVNYATQVSAALDANISAQQLPEILSNLVRLRNSMIDSISLTNNADLIAYAQAQEDGVPTYDPQAEFVVFRGLIDAAIATIQATPTNSLINAWTTDGIVWNTFTPAQTASLKADMDALVSGVI